MSEPVKQYTFAEVAKRECAECTTTITTTQEEKYVLASDHERVMAEKDAEFAEAHGVVWACEIRAEKAERERDKLRDVVQAALDWRGFDGDGITDPVRQQLVAALVGEEKLFGEMITIYESDTFDLIAEDEGASHGT